MVLALEENDTMAQHAPVSKLVGNLMANHPLVVFVKTQRWADNNCADQHEGRVTGCSAQSQ